MSDEIKQPEEAKQTIEQPNIEQPNIEQPTAANNPPPTPPVNNQENSGIDDVEAGKAFAILSYALSFIGIPFFLVPLIMRNNGFALFHAKQSLMIWLAGIALSVISGILTVICIGPFILLIGGIFLLVLNIIGLIKSINGQAEMLPLIGKWAEDWFKGIQKI